MPEMTSGPVSFSQELASFWVAWIMALMVSYQSGVGLMAGRTALTKALAHWVTPFAELKIEVSCPTACLGSGARTRVCDIGLV